MYVLLSHMCFMLISYAFSFCHLYCHHIPFFFLLFMLFSSVVTPPLQLIYNFVYHYCSLLQRVLYDSILSLSLLTLCNPVSLCIILHYFLLLAYNTPLFLQLSLASTALI